MLAAESSLRPPPSLVISTKRSAWRDLINAPLGASGEPQRFLDYARNDREEEKALLGMTMGGNGCHDKGVRERFVEIVLTIYSDSFCEVFG